MTERVSTSTYSSGPGWQAAPPGAGFSRFANIRAVCDAGGRALTEIPFSLRVLLENLLRQRIGGSESGVGTADLTACLRFEKSVGHALPLHVPRVILPDSSGIPVMQSLAALRAAVARVGGRPEAVQPRVPVHVIVDHSLQVDHAATPDAEKRNMAIERSRNDERYRFLRWAQQAFERVEVFPPGSGIIHQINLEHIASVVTVEDGTAFPDFVIGGDSHTPMVNALGVLGWGVGGIDVEAAMLGEAYVFPLPQVVGVRLVGSPQPGVMTTDLVLQITQALRKADVTGCFVEYFGPAIPALDVPERATIANMAPEYGATTGFFPVDAQTISYLAQTRSPAQAELVRRYSQLNGLFRGPDSLVPHYSRVIEIDVSQAAPSVAGPRRPQDRLALSDVAEDFRTRLARPLNDDGFGETGATEPGKPLNHGSIVIAAITSCTNTSNPRVMLAAGILARNARQRGLRPASHVKTSMAPGSRAVSDYLERTGLLSPLQELGFHVVGFGCTTCGGKSGPLAPEIAAEIEQRNLVCAAVLSGNRNFEGRIHKLVRANYIMSPPLVVAYAIAGRVDLDLRHEPIGVDDTGAPVYLHDIWPGDDEIAALLADAQDGEKLRKSYASRGAAEALWNALEAAATPLFEWDPESLYLLEPPFFDLAARSRPMDRIENARALAMFGDSLTTDHISPGGEIPADSEAGRYLLKAGVAQRDFNTYVARRGNHHVMTRATFANLRIRNRLAPAREGGWTRLFPEGAETTIFDAAETYRERGVPLIVLAGMEYGTGSSRDWAAKGTRLLGVQCVIAQSFERIHRANLIGLGVLPLAFAEGENAQTLGLDGSERFSISDIVGAVRSGATIEVVAQSDDGKVTRFVTTPQILNDSERVLFLGGGLPGRVLRTMLAESGGKATAQEME